MSLWSTIHEELDPKVPQSNNPSIEGHILILRNEFEEASLIMSQSTVGGESWSKCIDTFENILVANKTILDADPLLKFAKDLHHDTYKTLSWMLSQLSDKNKLFLSYVYGLEALKCQDELDTVFTFRVAKLAFLNKDYWACENLLLNPNFKQHANASSLYIPIRNLLTKCKDMTNIIEKRNFSASTSTMLSLCTPENIYGTSSTSMSNCLNKVLEELLSKVKQIMNCKEPIVCVFVSVLYEKITLASNVAETSPCSTGEENSQELSRTIDIAPLPSTPLAVPLEVDHDNDDESLIACPPLSPIAVPVGESSVGPSISSKSTTSVAATRDRRESRSRGSTVIVATEETTELKDSSELEQSAQRLKDFMEMHKGIFPVDMSVCTDMEAMISMLNVPVTGADAANTADVAAVDNSTPVDTAECINSTNSFFDSIKDATSTFLCMLSRNMLDHGINKLDKNDQSVSTTTGRSYVLNRDFHIIILSTLSAMVTKILVNYNSFPPNCTVTCDWFEYIQPLVFTVWINIMFSHNVSMAQFVTQLNENETILVAETALYFLLGKGDKGAIYAADRTGSTEDRQLKLCASCMSDTLDAIVIRWESMSIFELNENTDAASLANSCRRQWIVLQSLRCHPNRIDEEGINRNSILMFLGVLKRSVGERYGNGSFVLPHIAFNSKIGIISSASMEELRLHLNGSVVAAHLQQEYVVNKYSCYPSSTASETWFSRSLALVEDIDIFPNVIKMSSDMPDNISSFQTRLPFVVLQHAGVIGDVDAWLAVSCRFLRAELCDDAPSSHDTCAQLSAAHVQWILKHCPSKKWNVVHDDITGTFLNLLSNILLKSYEKGLCGLFYSVFEFVLMGLSGKCYSVFPMPIICQLTIESSSQKAYKQLLRYCVSCFVKSVDEVASDAHDIDTTDEVVSPIVTVCQSLFARLAMQSTEMILLQEGYSIGLFEPLELYELLYCSLGWLLQNYVRHKRVSYPQVSIVFSLVLGVTRQLCVDYSSQNHPLVAKVSLLLSVLLNCCDEELVASPPVNISCSSLRVDLKIIPSKDVYDHNTQEKYLFLKCKRLGCLLFQRFVRRSLILDDEDEFQDAGNVDTGASYARVRGSRSALGHVDDFVSEIKEFSERQLSDMACFLGNHYNLCYLMPLFFTASGSVLDGDVNNQSNMSYSCEEIGLLYEFICFCDNLGASKTALRDAYKWLFSLSPTLQCAPDISPIGVLLNDYIFGTTITDQSLTNQGVVDDNITSRVDQVNAALVNCWSNVDNQCPWSVLICRKFFFELSKIGVVSLPIPTDSSDDDNVSHEYCVGDKVEVLFGGGTIWYRGRVLSKHRDGTYDIHYDDGDSEKRVALEKVRSIENTKGGKHTYKPDPVLSKISCYVFLILKDLAFNPYRISSWVVLLELFSTWIYAILDQLSCNYNVDSIPELFHQYSVFEGSAVKNALYGEATQYLDDFPTNDHKKTVSAFLQYLGCSSLDEVNTRFFRHKPIGGKQYTAADIKELLILLAMKSSIFNVVSRMLALVYKLFENDCKMIQNDSVQESKARVSMLSNFRAVNKNYAILLSSLTTLYNSASLLKTGYIRLASTYFAKAVALDKFLFVRKEVSTMDYCFSLFADARFAWKMDRTWMPCLSLLRQCVLMLKININSSKGPDNGRAFRCMILYQLQSVRLKMALQFLHELLFDGGVAFAMRAEVEELHKDTFDSRISSGSESGERESLAEVLWNIIIDCFLALRYCRKMDVHDYKSVYLIAHTLHALSDMDIPNYLISKLFQRLEIVRNDENCVKNSLNTASLLELHKLFDKRRSQVVAVWIVESTLPFDMLMRQRCLKYDKIRRKYVRMYTHLLLQCLDEKRAEELMSCAAASKDVSVSSVYSLCMAIETVVRILESRLTDDSTSTSLVATYQKLFHVYMFLKDRELTTFAGDDSLILKVGSLLCSHFLRWKTDSGTDLKVDPGESGAHVTELSALATIVSTLKRSMTNWSVDCNPFRVSNQLQQTSCASKRKLTPTSSGNTNASSDDSHAAKSFIQDCGALSAMSTDEADCPVEEDGTMDDTGQGVSEAVALVQEAALAMNSVDSNRPGTRSKTTLLNSSCSIIQVEDNPIAPKKLKSGGDCDSTSTLQL